MMIKSDISIATNPFLSEKQREFWGQIEKRVQEEYNAASLPEYIENELVNNQNVNDISSKLDVEHDVLYRMMRKIGLAPLKIHRPYDKKSALEERIQQEYNISLSEYIFRKYHDEDCRLRPLAKEPGISRQTLLNWMKDYAIQRRKSYASPNKGKTFEEIYGLKKAKKIKRKMYLAVRRRIAE